jgi:hypothetical protein
MTPTPFLHFCNYLPFKRTWPFIWTKLNPLHPKIICTKFDWIWLAGSGEEDFKKFSVYFYTFAIISHWRRAIPSIWTNLNPPPPQDDLCQVWLKLAQWFWRRSRKCKSLQTDGQTDGQPAIRIAHLSFQLRWAKNLGGGGGGGLRDLRSPLWIRAWGHNHFKPWSQSGCNTAKTALKSNHEIMSSSDSAC